MRVEENSKSRADANLPSLLLAKREEQKETSASFHDRFGRLAGPSNVTATLMFSSRPLQAAPDDTQHSEGHLLRALLLCCGRPNSNSNDHGAPIASRRGCEQVAVVVCVGHSALASIWPTTTTTTTMAESAN